MIFNKTTTPWNGCIQTIEALSNLGLGGISDDAELLAQVTNYFNMSIREVEFEILRATAAKGLFDDFNYSNFPIATYDLVALQRDYPMAVAATSADASTLWKLNRVGILNPDGVTYTWIRPMRDKEEESVASLVSGFPDKYRIMGKSVRLDPVPATGSVTLTSGLKFEFARTSSDFVVGDTTKQPGFIDAFHDIPCYKTAAKFLMPTNPDLALSYDDVRPGRAGFVQGRMPLLVSAYVGLDREVSNEISTRRRPFR